MAVAEHAVPQRTPPSLGAASANPDLRMLMAPRTIDAVPFPPPSSALLLHSEPSSSSSPHQACAHSGSSVFPRRMLPFTTGSSQRPGRSSHPLLSPPLIRAGLGEGLQAARPHRAPSVPWAGKELQHFLTGLQRLRGDRITTL